MTEGYGNNPDEARERELVEAARRDPVRFADLYRHFFPRVYSFISRRVARRSDAEDLTAEVFHAVLEGLPKFEWRGVPFPAWVFRIAVNTIADHSARLAREGSIPNVEDISAAEVRAVDEDCRLGRLIAMLPADQRRVVESRFLEEKSVSEVASEMAKSEGAIRQLQFRALETLRKWLSDPAAERRRDNG